MSYSSSAMRRLCYTDTRRTFTMHTACLLYRYPRHLHHAHCMFAIPVPAAPSPCTLHVCYTYTRSSFTMHTACLLYRYPLLLHHAHCKFHCSFSIACHLNLFLLHQYKLDWSNTISIKSTFSRIKQNIKYNLSSLEYCHCCG